MEQSAARQQTAAPSGDRPDSAAPSAPWIGIAANAYSGMGQGRQRVERLAAALAQHGIATRVAWTQAERAELVDRAGRDPVCRGIVAAGGDGTVAALINERPAVPITVLPAGTENLFARHFGIGRQPEALAQAIVANQRQRIDLGVAGGRRFALMAGIGFDADVVTRHHAARSRGGRLRTTHRAAYVEPVLHASFSYRFPPLTVTVETPSGTETLVGTTVFLFNLPRYALGLPIAPEARADDGLLDVVVFRDPGPFRALHYLWLVFRGLHLHRPGVEHRCGSRVTVESPEDVPVQLDGDPGGTLASAGPGAWTATIEPGAIEVLVPPAYARRHAPAGA